MHSKQRIAFVETSSTRTTVSKSSRANMTEQQPSAVLRMMHLMMMMLLLLLLGTTQSFTIVSSPSRQSLRLTTKTTTTSTQLFFFGNGPKDDGSPGDYVCKVRVITIMQIHWSKYIHIYTNSLFSHCLLLCEPLKWFGLKDCGYVFTKGPAAWAALPDNYSCPPCGAPKRRFTKVPKGGATKNVKKTEEPPKKKSWF